MPAKGQDGPGTYYESCLVCGTPFKVRPSEVRKAMDRGCSAPIYCSLTCRDSAYVGSGNPKWRGGTTITKDGYVLRRALDHPHANRHGYVLEHRLVMEAHLGRILDPAEVVHHINHVRADNGIENLEVLPSGSAHRVHHGYWEIHPCGHCGVDVQRSIGHRRTWHRGFCGRACAAAAGSKTAAKLNPESVREIRSRSAAGETNKQLASAFSVSASLISCVTLRQIWGSVT